MKKLIAIMMAIIMTFSVLPIGASAHYDRSFADDFGFELCENDAHKWGLWGTQSDGRRIRACTICKLWEICDHEHMSDWETVTAATCADAGLEKRVCYDCPNEPGTPHVRYYTETREIPVDSSAHSLTAVSAVEATEETDGNIAYWYCDQCEKYFLDADATTETTQEATVIPALGACEHVWSDWTVTKAATCTAKGEESRTCSTCYKTETREIAVDPAAHSLTTVVAKDSTCQETGNSAYWICGTCGKLFSDAEGKNETTIEAVTLDRKDHTLGNPVRENEVAATCGKAGSYDEVVYCTVCDEEMSRETKTIPATGEHSWSEWSATKAATCTNQGEETRTCSVCGETETREISVDPNAHTLTTVAAKEATCKTAGNTGYWVCEECNKVFADSNGTVETTLDAVTIAKKGHTPDQAVRENEIVATCSKAGSYHEVVYCAVCGTELSRKTNTIAKIEHTPGTAVREKEVAATCTKDGSYDEVVYCSICGEELSRETKTVNKLGHTPADAVREKEVAATCTKDGSYDEVVYCSTCGEELSRETKTISKLSHTPGTAVRENEIAATCTKDGSYDEVVYCSICGEELSRETKTVAKNDHTWSSWVVTKEATAREEGSRKRVCSVCGEEETQIIPTPEQKDGTWKKSSSGWWYQYSDGSYPAGEWAEIDGVWYHFNASGYMQTGWYSEDGAWYFLKSSGAMATGWVKSGGKWYFMDASGVMQTGWINVNGTWYYLNASGAMLTGWQYIDGAWYYLYSSGAMATGWVKSGRSWYFLDASGAMQTGWIEDGDARYYLKASGAMATGWQNIDGNWYYFNSSGAMRTDSWLKSGGSWYYLLSDGTMAADTYIGSDYVNASGVWVR